jgi:transcriptional regulator with GAF, ATPase, and Fis domain
LLAPLTEAQEAGIAGEAQALLARVFFFVGKHKEAREVGEKGMLVLPPESRDFALCAAMVGLVRVYEGKLQQGGKYLETALAVLEKQGSASDVAFAANAVGLACHKLKDYGRAQEFYRKSLDVAAAAGDHERINVSSMNLSVVLQEMGDYSQAIARYEQALAMAYQSQDLPVLARITNNLGNIHRYLGMVQKARDFAERSIELADRLNMELNKGLNRMLMGEILRLQGKYEEAAALYDTAEAIFVAIKAPDERIECDIDRCELAAATERWDEACGVGLRAVEQSRELKLDNHRLRAILATAHALLKRNGAEDPGQAALLLEEATPLSAEAANPELEFKLWGLRTHACSSLGEPEKAAIAMRRAETALALLKQRIPEELQSVFFKRTDRNRALSEFAGLSSKMAQLAQTISPIRPTAVEVPHNQRWVSELVRMNARLLAEHDLEKLLETLIDVVVDLSGAERGFVILGSQAGLDVVVARNMDREAIRKSKGKFSTTIAHRVLETGEVIRLEDAIEADDFRSKKSIVALRIRSVICLPVANRGQTIGAIYLDNRFKPGVFSGAVVEMLTAFSEQAAIAIQNARLLAQYRSSLEELERSREEIERLNRKLEEKIEFQRLVIEQKSEEIDRQQAQLEERYQFSHIVGRSNAMERLFSVMQRVKETTVPVLVTGESGVGKELVARALHFSGSRKKQRFVSINCAALPDTLLESELFGYVEGAFTDARKEKKGLFALADQGTIFLDEVGDMSLSMQAKLLRVLQEGEFSPLGSEETVKVDSRVVAATNRDLKAMVNKGTFRQDLYYRLDVVTIRVPPLRDRKEDIPLLINHFLEEYAEKNKVPRPKMSMQAMQVLLAHDWPGNVRELQSVVTTAAVFAEGGAVVLESLRAKPEVFGASSLASDSMPSLDVLDLHELEKRAIAAALLKSNGNKKKAAEILGISRRALYNKLEANNMERAGGKENEER